jgi:hypothetical protein
MQPAIQFKSAIGCGGAANGRRREDFTSRLVVAIQMEAPGDREMPPGSSLISATNYFQIMSATVRLAGMNGSTCSV